MMTASDICDRLERQKMSARLGVGKTAISNAAVEGQFPARWFGVISAMCQEAGIECPTELFAFAKDRVAQPPAEPNGAAA